MTLDQGSRKASRCSVDGRPEACDSTTDNQDIEGFGSESSAHQRSVEGQARFGRLKTTNRCHSLDSRGSPQEFRSDSFPESVLLLLSARTNGARGRLRSRGEVMDIGWRSMGACRGLDPDIFFPDSDEQVREAKEICFGCDVRVSCLEHALASREKVGVWGGTTERERRRIIRQRRRTA